MKLKHIALFILLSGLAAYPSFSQKKEKPNPLKTQVTTSVDQRYSSMTDLSDKIWSFEEIAFRESQS
ncbi:MAG: amidohydrolase, partial [Algoriphagus sp.]|nr:amidohydrolase [Algoriphagus sp.]